MVRETSRKVFEEIRDSGLLSKIRLKVLENVMELAPCTSTELHQRMMFKFNMNGSWKSLSYLRDIGVLIELGTRSCTVTGRDVVEWDLTDELPSAGITKVIDAKPRSINRSIDYILKYIESESSVGITIENLKKLKIPKHGDKRSPSV